MHGWIRCGENKKGRGSQFFGLKNSVNSGLEVKRSGREQV